MLNFPGEHVLVVLRNIYSSTILLLSFYYPSSFDEDMMKDSWKKDEGKTKDLLSPAVILMVNGLAKAVDEY